LRDKGVAKRITSNLTVSIRTHPCIIQERVTFSFYSCKPPWLESIIVLALRIACKLLVNGTSETKFYAYGIGAS